LNAFCRWLHQEGHASQRVRLSPLKLEKRLLPVHNDGALRLLLGYRPRTFIQWPVHAIACTILDTGCRIDGSDGSGTAQLRSDRGVGDQFNATDDFVFFP
ncbi:MAG TPA: hypothetical protein VFB92_09185, partial [Vicinamibacterales bacterium]|nr:hypothetical protein [Vicinamibacterales bacterium]